MNIAVYMTISDHVFSPENSFRAFLFSKLNLNLNEGQSEPRFANTCLIKTLCYYEHFSLSLHLTFSLNSTRLRTPN